MSKNIQLGWFNAWVGLVWILLLVHSFKFFFAYEYFLQRSYVPVTVTIATVIIKQDPIVLKLKIPEGTFSHYNRDSFETIKDLVGSEQEFDVWVNEERKSIINFKVKGEFILGRSKLGIVLYLIGLIVSGGMVIISAVLIVKTNGWGSYRLMEKYKNK